MEILVKDPQLMELVEEVVEQEAVDLQVMNLLLTVLISLVVMVLLFLGYPLHMVIILLDTLLVVVEEEETNILLAVVNQHHLVEVVVVVVTLLVYLQKMLLQALDLVVVVEMEVEPLTEVEEMVLMV